MKNSYRQGQSIRRRGVGRRILMRLGSITVAAPALFFVRAEAFRPVEKCRSFYNLLTGERPKTVYRAEGHDVPGALNEIHWVVRDYHCNKVKPIKLQLLDLLYTLDRKLESRQPFHIICGSARQPPTNLRKHTAGVAKHSMHIQGKAVDIRIPGCRLAALQRAALALHDGGVGIYPVSGFVHVDVGRVRHW